MTDDIDEPELDPAERAALASWQAQPPPVGFADRVLAAPVAAAPVAAPVPPRRRLGAIAVIAGLAVAAASLIAIVATGTDADAPAAGTGPALDARRSLAIGGRAIAVAEPGATLSWTVGAGGARVEQTAGSVFYRVDHGSPFVVATSLGEVRVTGTCFQIEVIMKPTKQTVVGGAIGAAIAVAVVVTVYEGGVVVAGGKGSAQVGPGERATLTADGVSTGESTGGVADIAPPAAGATRDQLLARDELQRQRIAGLTSRVGELERQLASTGGGRGGDQDTADGRPWYDPGPAQLAEFAKNCEVRFDLPPIGDSAPFTLSADDAAHFGLTDAEIGPINAVMTELHVSWTEQIRAIYLDVVGEAGAVDGLSAQSMITEIEDKSPPGERSAIKARIAQERAGLATPPADWSHASPIERLFRSLAAIGDETERALGARIGADRAHAFRAKGGGWPSKRSMSGCGER